MRNKLIEYLLSISSTSDILQYGRLLFELNDFIIIVEYSNEIEEEEEEDVEFDRIQNLPDNYFQNKKIVDIYISEYEYLGDREQINEDISPISISIKLFSVLKKIYSQYPQSIASYKLNYNYGYIEGGEMCGGEPNYIYEIHISDKYFDRIDFFSFINEKSLFEIGKEFPFNFYWKTFASLLKNNTNIPDSKEVKIINTNTKARRLGYLKAFAPFFSDYPQVAASLINKKFEKYVNKYAIQLENYKNSKGLVKLTNSGISAKPYVNLAKEFNLINQLNNVFSPSKLFKVFIQLKKEEDLEDENIFKLSLLEKSFFLELILKYDFFYISALLEYIYIRDTTSFNDLSLDFNYFLLERGNEYRRTLGYLKYSGNQKLLKEFNEIFERIKKWNEPKTYLEHILMPRLNWLFDLELINLTNSLKVSLTEEGNRLFTNICIWNDINAERVISPQAFLDRFFIHVVNVIYIDSHHLPNEGKTTEIVANRIKFYINESFKHFKTLAPNRVTASQAILYTRNMLYFKENIQVGTAYIRRLLENQEFPDFIYKFQPQYGDGYIQKKNKI